MLAGREIDAGCPEQKHPNVDFGDLLMRIMYEKRFARCLVLSEPPYTVATMMEVMGER